MYINVYKFMYIYVHTYIYKPDMYICIQMYV